MSRSSFRKMIILGNYSVGKSSLLHRLHYGTFESLNPTIGVMYTELSIEGHQVQVWDTAGAEKFDSMLPLYIRNSDIIIVAFESDTTNVNDYISKYLSLIKSYSANSDVIFVGTKCDLTHELDRPFYYKDIVFTSSKTGEGIEELMEKILLVLNKNTFNNSTDTIRITNNKDRWGCC